MSFFIGSGQVVSGEIGNAAVVSGSIASGSIGHFHVASGAITSGQLGVTGTPNGTNFLRDDFSWSTPSATNAEILIDSTFITAELISGGRAVALNTSGRLQIAMASVSGRMPAIGVLETNVASGQSATIVQKGRAITAGFNFSGQIGNPMYVGASGTIEATPFSGSEVQSMGVAAFASGGTANELFVGLPGGIDAIPATRVVDPMGVNGTDRTIRAAILNSPTSGGTIFVHDGIYNIASGDLDFGGKTIHFTGAGKGGNAGFGATSLRFASGNITGFNAIGDGSYLSDFALGGDNNTAQIFLNNPDGGVIVENISVENVQGIIQTSTSNPEVQFRDCFLRLAGNVSGTIGQDTFFWRGATNGKMNWDNVEIFVPGAGNNLIQGATSGSAGCNWTALDSYTGGGGGGSSTNHYYTQRVDWLNLALDNAEITVRAAQNFIDSSFLEDASIKFFGVWNRISNTIFSAGGPGTSGFFTAQVSFVTSGSAFPLQSSVDGCLLYGNGTSLRGVEVINSQDIVITGCDFFNHTQAGVYLASGTGFVAGQVPKASVTGCRFTSTGVPAILEADSSPVGRYSANELIGATMNSGSILGPNSVVEGMRRFDTTSGLTTSGYVTQFTHQNVKGLLGIGTIVNTSGANSLDVAINVAGPFGLGSGGPFAVAAGNSLMLDEQINIGAGFPPYTSYSVAVRNTASGAPTGFRIHHGSQGAN
jgi:hypothetical protein